MYYLIKISTTVFTFLVLKLCVYMCLCVGLCMCGYRWQQSPEEGVWWSGAEFQVVMSCLRWVMGSERTIHLLTAEPFLQTQEVHLCIMLITCPDYVNIVNILVWDPFWDLLPMVQVLNEAVIIIGTWWRKWAKLFSIKEKVRKHDFMNLLVKTSPWNHFVVNKTSQQNWCPQETSNFCCLL